MVGAQPVPLRWVRHYRARRYVLRVKRDGSVRVTIPRHGTQQEARAFVHRHSAWIESQYRKLLAEPRLVPVWRQDTEILFRGERVRLNLTVDGTVAVFADQSIVLDNAPPDWRPPIERHLRQLAEVELIPRTWELYGRCVANPDAVSPRPEVSPDESRSPVISGRRPVRVLQRIVIRNQRTRWGSCSCRGTVSLNWRLIQTPDWVRDYLILHELAHLWEMNHSPRFWRWVALWCPLYEPAERWMKAHHQWLSGP